MADTNTTRRLSPRELVAFESLLRGKDGVAFARDFAARDPQALAKLDMKMRAARAYDHLGLANTRAEIIERQAKANQAPVFCGKAVA